MRAIVAFGDGLGFDMASAFGGADGLGNDGIDIGGGSGFDIAPSTTYAVIDPSWFSTPLVNAMYVDAKSTI